MNEKEIGTATPSRVRTRRWRASRRLRPKPHRRAGAGLVRACPSPRHCRSGACSIATGASGRARRKLRPSRRRQLSPSRSRSSKRWRNGAISPDSSSRWNRSRCARGSAAISNPSISPTVSSSRRRPSLRHRAASPLSSLSRRPRPSNRRLEAQLQLARPNSNAPRNLKNDYATKETYDERRRWRSPSRRAMPQSPRSTRPSSISITRVTVPVPPHGTP